MATKYCRLFHYCLVLCAASFLTACCIITYHWHHSSAQNSLQFANYSASTRAELSESDISIIVKDIINGSLPITTMKASGVSLSRTLIVPASLLVLYEHQRLHTIAALIGVIEEGSPFKATTAMAYLVALNGKPEVASSYPLHDNDEDEDGFASTREMYIQQANIIMRQNRSY